MVVRLTWKPMGLSDQLELGLELQNRRPARDTRSRFTSQLYVAARSRDLPRRV